MIATGNSEYNNIGAGGYGAGYAGGWGGIAPVGLFGIANGVGFGGSCHSHGIGGTPNLHYHMDRDGHRHDHCDDDNHGPLFILNAVGNIKDTVSNAKDALAEQVSSVKDNVGSRLDSVKDALTSRIDSTKDQVVSEARALFSAICDVEKTSLQQFNALAIQASNNTQSIKDQATAQHALILARLNEFENQRLRDDLHEVRRGRDNRDLEIRIENTNTNVNAQFQAQAQAQLQRDFEEHRRRYDNREIEINNINTNTNIQAQVQAQAQAQAIRELDRDHRWNARFDTLVSQNAKVAQDIINIGSGIVGANQTSNPTNVNSKLQQ